MELKNVFLQNDTNNYQNDYEAPLIVVEEVIVEEGFAQSGGNWNPNPPEPGWG